MKIGFSRHPHAGQTGKVVDLFDVAEGLIHQSLDQAPSLRYIELPAGQSRRAKIEYAHLSALRDERSIPGAAR